MGLISDILESNLERGQCLTVLLLPSGPSKLVNITMHEPAHPNPLLHCPLCGKIVIEDKDLKQHFLDSHANRYVYLSVNGQVIRDAVYTDNKITSIVAHLIGIQRAQIKIEASDIAPIVKDFRGAFSVMEHLHGFQEGVINITVNIPGGFREYCVYCRKLPEVGTEEIDRASSELLFYPLNENKQPVWNTFQNKYIDLARNKLEQKYAEGLFEYAAGAHAVRKGHYDDGRNRLESALGYLLSFRTAHALTIQRILALRMNLFGLLRLCTPPSKFASANDFFNDREMRLSRKQVHVESLDGLQEYRYAIYIDQFTKMFLDALNAYYNEDYALLDEFCGQLNLILREKDRNNSDKLLLLCARTCLKKSNKTSAVSIYQMLIDNPDFKQEAREVLDGT